MKEETTRPLTLGVLALGRATFDVPYAEEMMAQAWQTLRGLGCSLAGEPVLCLEADAVHASTAALREAQPDLLVILQVTFTDAALTTELLREWHTPALLWSFPEARTGGRLRLNAFCGVNLACHALSRHGIRAQTLHAAPGSAHAAAELRLLAEAAGIVGKLRRAKVLVVGDHPQGFDACNYDHDQLAARFGTHSERMPVHALIAQASALPENVTEAPWQRRSRDFSNLAEMPEAPARKTLKVYAALQQQAKTHGYDGIAVRCWPDFFTDYGCAACGALALMNEDKIPCGCEADMFGVLSSLLLQWASGQGAFNTDLVDIDPEQDSVVFWHCGQAPIEMADRDAPVRAALHSNRKLPLLSEFALKPGRITLCRISQGQGKLRLMLAGGEMLKAPLAFSGTAGVARLDVHADLYRQRLLDAGMEHHTSLAYGDHRPLLRKVAQLLDLELLELA